MKLLFCGDIVPTPVTAPAFERADSEALFGTALPLIREADFAVANLECALTDGGAPIRKCGPNLKGRPAYARVLKEAGFTHLGLANNHMLDFGVAGLRDTVAALREADITDFGWGEDDQDSRKPVFLLKDGLKVAVVAVAEHEYSYALPDQPGANPLDPYDSMEDIAEASAAADYTVVMLHGGKEQCTVPSPRLRKCCHAMARAGADLILCQHSHCVGCRETYHGAEIVYGEGNFNFVSHTDHPHWQTGLCLSVELEKGVEPRLAWHPVAVTETGITLAAESEAILAGFEERSEHLHDGRWLEDWKAFCGTVPYYYDAVRMAYTDVPEGEACRQIFPHYLDCEAHLDVFKTIYRTWHAEKTAGA